MVHRSASPRREPARAWGPGIGLPGKIVCIGYHSRAHARQMGREPDGGGALSVLLTPSSALCGPNDPIPYAYYAGKLD